MSDLFDYLRWRGDIRFDQLPVNPVDSLVFSVLSYIDFSGIVPDHPGETISLAEAAQKFLSLSEQSGRVRLRRDLALLKAAGEAERFREVGMTFYRAELCHEEESQFAAVTFLPWDGGAYLAFRGTDYTLVGWKEDFNMSFQPEIPAQRKALAYLRTFAAHMDLPLRLGGHSKGGNLAVYAASKADPALQQRIKVVYNQDGPGFTGPMMGDPGYISMVSRIQTFLPQSSVVGMLMDRLEPVTVIKSKLPGLLQHEPYSWEVLGGGFIPVEAQTRESRLLDKTLKSWLAGMTHEERNAFVDTVYELLTAGGASVAIDLIRPRNVRGYLRTLGKDENTRRIIAGELAGLIQSARKTLKEAENEE